ncbi:MAG: tetratricopeptide repeat protein, partial [bacterium]
GEIKGITEGAGSVLDPLIENLPECLGVTKLIITSRYRLPLEEFEYISMRSMKGADEKKKVEKLPNINHATDQLRDKLIEAGRGNPALLEKLDALTGRMEGAEPGHILSVARAEAERFKLEHLDNALTDIREEHLRRFLSEISVFDIPVPFTGFETVSGTEKNGELLEKGTALGMIEADVFSRSGEVSFMVSPLFREKFFQCLTGAERKQLHKKARRYIAKLRGTNIPLPAVDSREIVKHGLNRQCGNKTDRLSDDYSGMGQAHFDLCEFAPAAKYFKLALTASKNMYGEKHHRTALCHKNLGMAYERLGDLANAGLYINKARMIFSGIYGNDHHTASSAREQLEVIKKRFRMEPHALETEYTLPARPLPEGTASPPEKPSPPAGLEIT